jgi:hypothetical protein
MKWAIFVYFLNLSERGLSKKNGVVKFLFDFAANGQATNSQWQ